LFIGAGGGDRQVAGAFFEVDVEFGEAAVEPASSVQRHCCVAGGREQWVREVDPVAVELDHAVLSGLLDLGDNARPERLEQRHRGGREGGDRDESVADRRRQYEQPLGDERAQAPRQRDLGAVDADRAPGDRMP
jgi:hypothetical protein